jgi:hypothetical protein
MADENDKGFTIKDKRIFNADGNPVESPQHEVKTTAAAESRTAQGESAASTDEEPLSQQAGPLEINFSSFVLSLSSSALYHFGELPDPITHKKQRNLVMAKQTIDILGILKDKTTGNLTKQEEALLSNLLYDLRMRYVQESGKDKTNQ